MALAAMNAPMTTPTSTFSSLVNLADLATVLPPSLLKEALTDEHQAWLDYLSDWNAYVYGCCLDSRYAYMTAMPPPEQVNLGVIATDALERGLVTVPGRYLTTQVRTLVYIATGNTVETVTSTVPLTTFLFTDTGGDTRLATVTAAITTGEDSGVMALAHDNNTTGPFTRHESKIAVSLGVGLPLLLLVVGSMLWWRRRRKRTLDPTSSGRTWYEGSRRPLSTDQRGCASSPSLPDVPEEMLLTPRPSSSKYSRSSTHPAYRMSPGDGSELAERYASICTLDRTAR